MTVRLASVNRSLPIAAALAAVLLGACGTTPAPVAALSLGADPAAACTALTTPVPASAIGLPSGPASIESAMLMPETERAVAERGPSPAARITPATPRFCRLVGQIAPLDPQAPP